MSFIVRLIGGPLDGKQLVNFAKDKLPATITAPGKRRGVGRYDLVVYRAGYVDNGIAYYIHESLRVKTA